MNNNLDKQYTDLLKDILENGTAKMDRTGTGTISVFGRQIRHSMKDGFPLLTTKKMYFKGIVTELLWFLQGRTDLKWLLENGCHIWTGDAYKVYDKDFDIEHPPFSAPYPKRLTKEEFEKKILEDDEFNKWYGDLGKIYGAQWRKWPSIKRIKYQDGPDIHNAYPDYGDIDQIQNLIHDLKTNPDSRRLMVNAWNVGELDQMVLPPCHYGFQVYTRELSFEERKDYAIDILGYEALLDYGHSQNDDDKILDFLNYWNVPKRAISLMFNMRSTDVGLGLPFNLASYGLLLLMIAKQVNMVPDELIYNGGDVHIYSNHVDILQQNLDRIPYELPNVTLTDKPVNDISEYTLGDIVLENYQSHPPIKLPLSN